MLTMAESRGSAPSLPDFLIIGAPKAATTWLADALREHPDVYLPADKELRYFCGGNYGRGMQWYEQQFVSAGAAQIRGEASPSYLGSPEAPERIASLLPGVRLLLSLRHPVDQAYSFFWHLLARGHLPADQEFADFIAHRRPRAGYYGENLARYLQWFAPEQILVLLYEEDIQKNPAQALRQCYRFLEIDPRYQPGILQGRSNARREVTAVGRLSRRLRRYQGWLPRPWVQSLKRLSHGMLDRLPVLRRQQPLDPQWRGRLLERYYGDDIQQLERLSGRDFSSWLNGH